MPRIGTFKIIKGMWDASHVILSLKEFIITENINNNKKITTFFCYLPYKLNKKYMLQAKVILNKILWMKNLSIFNCH